MLSRLAGRGILIFFVLFFLDFSDRPWWKNQLVPSWRKMPCFNWDIVSERKTVAFALCLNQGYERKGLRLSVSLLSVRDCTGGCRRTRCGGWSCCLPIAWYMDHRVWMVYLELSLVAVHETSELARCIRFGKDRNLVHQWIRCHCRDCRMLVLYIQGRRVVRRDMICWWGGDSHCWRPEAFW